MRIFLSSTANGNCAKYSIIPLKSKTFKVSFMFIHLRFNNNFPDTAVTGKPLKSIRKCFVWFYKEQKLRNALQFLLDFQMNCSCMKPSNYYYFIYSNDEKKTFRSSPPEALLRKCVLKTCRKFTGKHLCRSVISMKLQSNFIEITLRHECSPENLLYAFRTPFPKNSSAGLLLHFFKRLN